MAKNEKQNGKFDIDITRRQEFAKALAGRRKKWAGEEQRLYLALILREAGVEPPKIQGIVDAADWHGAALNGSQFSQWADGKDSTLKLDYKLRTEREAKVNDIMERLAEVKV